MIIKYNFSLGEERIKDDWKVIEGFHNDTIQAMKLFDDYPSHLHIDLVPRAQGSLVHFENE
jgi:hypothetical protein